MNNYTTMTADFERQKNAQAALYTGAIAGILLLTIWFVKFYEPVVPPAPVEEYVEIALPEPPPVEDVNLGNNDVGTGNVQPIVTGTPSSSPVAQEVSETKSASPQQATKDFDEDNDNAAPPITKPSRPNPTAKEITNNTNEQSTATGPQLRRGAQMTSVRGSGNGGNTDELGYNRPGSQGPGDGPGDKGVLNGDPKGKRYLGVRTVSIPAQSFEDDFNENGKVALDIVVDENGRLLSSNFQPRGSTLSSRKHIDIAKRRAAQVNYPKYEGGFKQTIIMEFQVKN